jgi:hypothetical protein
VAATFFAVNVYHKTLSPLQFSSIHRAKCGERGQGGTHTKPCAGLQCVFYLNFFVNDNLVDDCNIFSLKLSRIILSTIKFCAVISYGIPGLPRKASPTTLSKGCTETQDSLTTRPTHFQISHCHQKDPYFTQKAC